MTESTFCLCFAPILASIVFQTCLDRSDNRIESKFTMNHIVVVHTFCVWCVERPLLKQIERTHTAQSQSTLRFECRKVRARSHCYSDTVTQALTANRKSSESTWWVNVIEKLQINVVYCQKGINNIVSFIFPHFLSTISRWIQCQDFVHLAKIRWIQCLCNLFILNGCSECCRNVVTSNGISYFARHALNGPNRRCWNFVNHCGHQIHQIIHPWVKQVQVGARQIHLQ